ncbi:hypothetical protein [Streptomyces sp. NPDC001020]
MSAVLEPDARAAGAGGVRTLDQQATDPEKLYESDMLELVAMLGLQLAPADRVLLHQDERVVGDVLTDREVGRPPSRASSAAGPMPERTPAPRGRALRRPKG